MYWRNTCKNLNAISSQLPRICLQQLPYRWLQKHPLKLADSTWRLSGPGLLTAEGGSTSSNSSNRKTSDANAWAEASQSKPLPPLLKRIQLLPKRVSATRMYLETFDYKRRVRLPYPHPHPRTSAAGTLRPKSPEAPPDVRLPLPALQTGAGQEPLCTRTEAWIWSWHSLSPFQAPCPTLLITSCTFSPILAPPLRGQTTYHSFTWGMLTECLDGPRLTRWH